MKAYGFKINVSITNSASGISDHPCPGFVRRKSIENFGVLKDRPVNNFIGSKSLEYNLRFIPEHPIFGGRLKETDKEKLLAGMEEILPHWHAEKIWAIIWERWGRYVQICHQE